MSTHPLKVGLIGLGTVGQGVVRVLARNAEEISRRAGRKIEVVMAAARDISKPRDCDLSNIRVVGDPWLVARSEVDVVVELIGGLEPAEGLITEAMSRGRHVVTANKALLAERGAQLFQRAKASGSILAFEAAVAGGIPIIKVLREGLAANRITGIAGIINGTSNYILTQMRGRGADFGEVLAEAQELGYAEADPTFDIEGIDAGHKLTLLAAIALGTPLTTGVVTCEGISTVHPQDIQLAEELGYRIKSLGIGKLVDGRVELRVQPTLVPVEQMLAKVDGVLNAIFVDGDAVGQTVYVGRGAGAEATASAVIADLVDIARLQGTASKHWVPSLGSAFQGAPPAIVPKEEVESAYYLRLRVADQPGVLRELTSILAALDISVEAILQKEPKHGQDATIAIITSVIAEKRCQEAMARMKVLPFLRPGMIRLHVEHFD